MRTMNNNIPFDPMYYYIGPLSYPQFVNLIPTDRDMNYLNSAISLMTIDENEPLAGNNDMMVDK